MLIDIDRELAAKLLECVSSDVEVATNEASSVLHPQPSSHYFFLLELPMAQRLRSALEKAFQK